MTWSREGWPKSERPRDYRRGGPMPTTGLHARDRRHGKVQGAPCFSGRRDRDASPGPGRVASSTSAFGGGPARCSGRPSGRVTSHAPRRAGRGARRRRGSFCRTRSPRRRDLRRRHGRWRSGVSRASCGFVSARRHCLPHFAMMCVSPWQSRRCGNVQGVRPSAGAGYRLPRRSVAVGPRSERRRDFDHVSGLAASHAAEVRRQTLGLTPSPRNRRTTAR